MELDNEKCLLLEFVNEDKKISVGFQSWLEDRNIGDKELSNIIKNKIEVKIKWPNCDIAPAIIKKRIKTCTFKTVVARILSFGGMYIYLYTFYFIYEHEIHFIYNESNIYI